MKLQHFIDYVDEFTDICVTTAVITLTPTNITHQLTGQWGPRGLRATGGSEQRDFMFPDQLVTRSGASNLFTSGACGLILHASDTCSISLL